MTQTHRQDAEQADITSETNVRAPLWKLVVTVAGIVIHAIVIYAAITSVASNVEKVNIRQDNRIETNEKAITALEIRFNQLQSETKGSVTEINNKLASMDKSLVEIKTTLQYIAPKPKTTTP